jgi:hypothetical protein
MDKVKTRTVAIRLTAEEWQILSKIAKKEARAVGAQALLVIRQYLNEQKDK